MGGRLGEGKVSGKWSGGLVVSGGLAGPNWPIWGVTGGPKIGSFGGSSCHQEDHLSAATYQDNQHMQITMSLFLVIHISCKSIKDSSTSKKLQSAGQVTQP